MMQFLLMFGKVAPGKPTLLQQNPDKITSSEVNSVFGNFDQNMGLSQSPHPPPSLGPNPKKKNDFLNAPLIF